MERHVKYQPCPISLRSPEGDMRIRVLGFSVAILFALFLVFLGLYAWRESSDPARQLRDCQAQLQNQSSQTQAQTTSLRQCMEETLEAAKKEAGILSHQLEAMNETQVETQKNWHSCQNQLSSLQDNFTSLESKERSQKDAIKNLQQQLTEKSKQLNDEQQKIQEERMRYQAEIQQLRDQLEQKQQHNSNGGGPSIPLLFIIIAGFLST